MAGAEVLTDDSRDLIDEVIERGDIVTARSLMARWWRRQPGPAVANFINSRVARLPAAPERATLSVGVVRSFTIEPVIPILRAVAAVNGLDVTVHVGGFNTYAEELLDPGSPVYTEWAADAVILAVQTRDIVPELWNGYHDLSSEDMTAVRERVCGEYEAIVTVYRRTSNGHLIVHGLELPTERSLGVADEHETVSQRSLVREINAHIGTICRTQTGVHFLDLDGVISECGRRAWFDERKWLAMRMPIRAEFQSRLASEWLRYLVPITGAVAKAIVVDLDNTLWGGVLGEDGPDGILIGPDHPASSFLEIQRALLEVRSRGVLLAVCSKNNHDEVMEVLRTHPHMLIRPEHLAAIRANWDDKATDLRSIAQELNIGIDAIAFVDDSPVECELVRRELSELHVIELDGEPTGYAGLIRDNPMFERLVLSAEDRERSGQYAERSAVEALRTSMTSLEEFLRSLGTGVEVAFVTDATRARVAQLTQKTNQFNLTTRRYSEQQIDEMMASPCVACVHGAVPPTGSATTAWSALPSCTWAPPSGTSTPFC